MTGRNSISNDLLVASTRDAPSGVLGGPAAQTAAAHTHLPPRRASPLARPTLTAPYRQPVAELLRLSAQPLARGQALPEGADRAGAVGPRERDLDRRRAARAGEAREDAWALHARCMGAAWALHALCMRSAMDSAWTLHGTACTQHCHSQLPSDVASWHPSHMQHHSKHNRSSMTPPTTRPSASQSPTSRLLSWRRC